METFEYDILEIPSQEDKASILTQLNQVGGQGWEVAGIDSGGGFLRIFLIRTTPAG